MRRKARITARNSTEDAHVGRSRPTRARSSTSWPGSARRRAGRSPTWRPGSGQCGPISTSGHTHCRPEVPVADEGEIDGMRLTALACSPAAFRSAWVVRRTDRSRRQTPPRRRLGPETGGPCGVQTMIRRARIVATITAAVTHIARTARSSTQSASEIPLPRRRCGSCEAWRLAGIVCSFLERIADSPPRHPAAHRSITRDRLRQTRRGCEHFDDLRVTAMPLPAPHEPGDDVAVPLVRITSMSQPASSSCPSLRMFTALSLRNARFAMRVVPPPSQVDLVQAVDDRVIRVQVRLRRLWFDQGFRRRRRRVGRWHRGEPGRATSELARSARPDDGSAAGRSLFRAAVSRAHARHRRAVRPSRRARP